MNIDSSKIRQSLRHSVRDGCAHSVMVGSGETYLVPFALFFGASSSLVGLLVSLPLFIGAMAQLLSLHFLQHIQHRKTLIVRAAIFQGLTWLVLLFTLLYQGASSSLILLFSLLYFFSGHLISPAWISMMGDLVPTKERGHYFGYRNRRNTGFQLCAFATGGVVLHLLEEQSQVRWGYFSLFCIAILARLYSAYELHKMHEPTYHPPLEEEHFSFSSFIKQARHTNFGRFTLFLFCLLSSTNLASPFFTVLMLKELKFSYVQFSMATMATILAHFMTTQNWGKIADRFGNKKTLAVTTTLVSFLPLLWLTSKNFYLILLFQTTSGLLWAGLNLSAANFIFDAVKPAKRPRCVAYYNTTINTGIFLGASLGGLLTVYLPSSLSLGSYSLKWSSNLYLLFILSSLCRFTATLIFLPRIHEERSVEEASSWKVVFNMIRFLPPPDEFGTRFMNLILQRKNDPPDPILEEHNNDQKK